MEATSNRLDRASRHDPRSNESETRIQCSAPCPNSTPQRGYQRECERPDENTNEIQGRSEEHTSELQSQSNLVCRLLLEKKKKESVKSKPTCTDSRSANCTHIATAFTTYLTVCVSDRDVVN